MQFEHLTGVKLVHVPYRGGGPAATAVMGGEVQLTFSGIPNVLGGIQSGQLRPIAIATEQRYETLPDVPTFRELGVNYVQGTWFGLLAPSRTPEPIIRRIYEVTRQVLQLPDVRKAMETQGAETVGGTPQEFAKVIADDTKFWSEILANMPKMSQ
jgi:tripartite-type tricarboxylate transporter receptor subunit TctC